MADLNKYVQTNTFYLAGSGVVIGATSAALTSFTDIYGNVLTMTDFGTTGYITFEPDTTNEESATFTGITANANGTYTLTGVKTTLAKAPYTQTSGLVRQHSGGTKVVVTDNVAFWDTFANKANDETVTGVWGTANVPSSGNDFTNKTYVDGVAIAGAPDASTTTKGITKLDTAPAAPTSPIAVGVNSLLVAPATGTSGGILGFTSTTARASSVLLTNHALIVGGGAGATPTPLASLGTTTTLLHGNASGDPTFGAVTLTTEVTGILPVANGGTGSATLPFSGLFKNGTTTYNISTASGAQTIAHGLGVAPKYVRLTFAAIGANGTTIGNTFYAYSVYNGTTQSSVSVYYDSTATPNVSLATTLNLNISVTGDKTATGAAGVITFDATNITVTWTKTGSPTGIYTLLWEAFS